MRWIYSKRGQWHWCMLCWWLCFIAVSAGYGEEMPSSCWMMCDSVSISGVKMDTLSSSTTMAKNDSVLVVKKHSWLAAAEIAGLNVGLLLFDRYILNGAYAHVTLKSIRRNLHLTKWFWDSDKMYTNLMEHPYHGMLYYNASRSNGMGFGVSSLYTVAGSLMWELTGEMELPSVNDFIATSLGGIAIGEASYRLSDLLLDDRTTGTSRMFRELGSALLNPMRGLTRLLTGEAWRCRIHRSSFIPKLFETDVVVGLKSMQVSGRSHNRTYGAFFDVGVRYGEVVVEESTVRPFDRFVLSMGLSALRGQHVLNHFSLRGRLYAKQLSWGGFDSELGLYQHFGYYSTDAVDDGEIPYKFSEAGSVGGAFVFTTGDAGNFRVEQELFVNGILLGGMMSDYRGNLIDRDYNIGSGFSLKSFTNFRVGRWLYSSIDMAYYRLFTWLDFSKIDTNRPSLEWSTQGNGSVAGLYVLSPRLDIRLKKDFCFHLSGSYYNRHTRYDHFPNCHSHTWELRLGMCYRIN